MKGLPITKNKSIAVTPLWWCLVMLVGKEIWLPSGGLALDDGYMWSVYGFCLIDIIYGNLAVSYLVFPDGLF